MELIETEKNLGGKTDHTNRQQCDFMRLLVKIRRDTQKNRLQGDIISLLSLFQNKNKLRSMKKSVPPDVAYPQRGQGINLWYDKVDFLVQS